MRTASSVTLSIEEIAKITALLNTILDRTEEYADHVDITKMSIEKMTYVETIASINKEADKIYRIINERTQEANRAATKLEI